jgi:hypothetical protein
MPGYCPVPLTPPALRLWKTFRSMANTIPVDGKKCSPSHRNGVRLQNGIAFAFDRIPQGGLDSGVNDDKIVFICTDHG